MTSGRAPHVIAVADSDSYLKWAAWTLAGLREDVGARTSVLVVRSPLAPTAGQVAAAVAGSGVAAPPVLGPRALARRLSRDRPDVVLVAATGPVAELVARLVVRAVPGRRPALVTGLPGIALPATEHGTGWRRWCDAFVVHGRVEIEPYAAAFAKHGVRPQLPLARLPFLEGALERVSTGAGRAGEVSRVVFAAQAKVPSARADRVALLDALARLAADGFDVVVKLRARALERQTHDEAHPLDALWGAEHARLGHPLAALRFETGPMTSWLTPGTALATVSSTAALESLARGLPTVLVGDFGVGPELLNEPFAGSGCLLRIGDTAGTAATLRAGGPTPAPAWCEQHWLHAAPSQLPGAVERLVAAARAGDLPPVRTRPWSWPRHAYTVVRSAIPLRVAGAVGPAIKPAIKPGGRTRLGR